MSTYNPRKRRARLETDNNKECPGLYDWASATFGTLHWGLFQHIDGVCYRAGPELFARSKSYFAQGEPLPVQIISLKELKKLVKVSPRALEICEQPQYVDKDEDATYIPIFEDLMNELEPHECGVFYLVEDVTYCSTMDEDKGEVIPQDLVEHYLSALMKKNVTFVDRIIGEEDTNDGLILDIKEEEEEQQMPDLEDWDENNNSV